MDHHLIHKRDIFLKMKSNITIFVPSTNSFRICCADQRLCCHRLTSCPL